MRVQLVAPHRCAPSSPSSPYNVKYDFKKAKPISATSGSNLITSSTAVFATADLGSIVAMSNAGSNGALVGYIGQVVDSKNIRIFTDKTFATPMNASSTQSNQEMVWGTDNTAALQQAFDDAEPVSTYYGGKTVVIGGIALATQLRFGSIAIVGLADTACGFAALPLASSSDPFFADKNTGTYATLKPDGYTLKNLTFYGQRYTQYYSSFRNTLEIRGGGFQAFRRGAPYARIENIDCFEAQYNGIVTNGAFGGQFNNIRSLFNAQCGMRMGFWDLNGQNWHVEGNGGAGVLSIMPGANVSTVRAAYNGAAGGSIYQAGGYWPNELGSNFTECGYGNIYTNLRMQESWAHNLCISNQDPLNSTKTGGGKCAFYLSTFDDTGNITPAHGVSTTRLPGVRAMVYLKGSSAVNCTVNLSNGAPHVSTTNYATNAYADEGNPSGNQVSITTPGTANTSSAYYPGGTVSGSTTSTAATSPGPTYTASSSSIANRSNSVSINGQVAP